VEQNLTTLEQIQRLAAAPAMTEVHGVPVVCLPPDWKAEDQARLLPAPQNISESINFVDLTSFIDYVNRFKLPDRTIIHMMVRSGSLKVTASQSGISATAKLDYHKPPEEAHWCNHSAHFKTTVSPAWDAWSAQNGRWMKQSEFADFLYNNQVEIVEPAGAELLEIVHTLKATAKGEFRDMRDLSTGSSELIYRMTVNAQGGTQEKLLSLPRQFRVQLNPFYGCPTMQLRADILLTAPKEDGGALQLAYRFYRLTDDLELLFKAIQDQIRTSTELPVYR